MMNVMELNEAGDSASVPHLGAAQAEPKQATQVAVHQKSEIKPIVG